MFSSSSPTLSILHCCLTFLDASVYWLHTSGSILWVRYCRRRRNSFRNFFSFFLFSRKWTFNREIMKLKKGNKGEDVSQEIGPHKNCSVPFGASYNFFSLPDWNLSISGLVFASVKEEEEHVPFFFFFFRLVSSSCLGNITQQLAHSKWRERRLWFFPL